MMTSYGIKKPWNIEITSCRMPYGLISSGITYGITSNDISSHVITNSHEMTSGPIGKPPVRKPPVE